MNRRNLFRMLGLGVASAALAPLAAKAELVQETRPIMQVGPYLGHGVYEAVAAPSHTHTGSSGAHTHSLSLASSHTHTWGD